MITIQEIHPEETWPIRHQVMWPHMPPAYVQLEEDNEGEHFGLYRDDALVSIVSCFWTGDDMQFRKFATLESYQGQGLGSRLLNHVMDNAKNRNAKRIWCNARADKASFYHKFGLVEAGEVFLKEDIAFVKMELRLR